MKKHKSLIILLIIISSVVLIYNIPKINAYVIATQNDLRFTDLRFGPYYTITEGMNKQEETVYIIKMDRVKGNHLINQKDGITYEEALRIANENGFTNEKNEIELWISYRKTGKIDNYVAVKKNLVWCLYYDEANRYFVEVDFETGELFDFSRSIIQNLGND